MKPSQAQFLALSLNPHGTLCLPLVGYRLVSWNNLGSKLNSITSLRNLGFLFWKRG